MSCVTHVKKKRQHVGRRRRRVKLSSSSSSSRFDLHTPGHSTTTARPRAIYFWPPPPPPRNMWLAGHIHLKSLNWQTDNKVVVQLLGELHVFRAAGKYYYSNKKKGQTTFFRGWKCCCYGQHRSAAVGGGGKEFDAEENKRAERLAFWFGRWWVSIIYLLPSLDWLLLVVVVVCCWHYSFIPNVEMKASSPAAAAAGDAHTHTVQCTFHLASFYWRSCRATIRERKERRGKTKRLRWQGRQMVGRPKFSHRVALLTLLLLLLCCCWASKTSLPAHTQTHPQQHLDFD